MQANCLPATAPNSSDEEGTNMTKLWNIITADGSRKPYGMTESLELAGKIPEESKAVKCDDDIFLVMVKDGLKVYSTGTGQFAEPDSFPVTDAADGFKTEISLAPEVILPTEFTAGGITIGNEELPVTVRKIREKMLILQFGEGEAMLFDTSRFLLYAFAGEEFICGYVEV